MSDYMKLAAVSVIASILYLAAVLFGGWRIVTLSIIAGIALIVLALQNAERN